MASNPQGTTFVALTIYLSMESIWGSINNSEAHPT